jgi:hypothetical protein
LDFNSLQKSEPHMSSPDSCYYSTQTHLGLHAFQLGLGPYPNKEEGPEMTLPFWLQRPTPLLGNLCPVALLGPPQACHPSMLPFSGFFQTTALGAASPATCECTFPGLGSVWTWDVFSYS